MILEMDPAGVWLEWGRSRLNYIAPVDSHDIDWANGQLNSLACHKSGILRRESRVGRAKIRLLKAGRRCRRGQSERTRCQCELPDATGCLRFRMRGRYRQASAHDRLLEMHSLEQRGCGGGAASELRWLTKRFDRRKEAKRRPLARRRFLVCRQAQLRICDSIRDLLLALPIAAKLRYRRPAPRQAQAHDHPVNFRQRSRAADAPA